MGRQIKNIDLDIIMKANVSNANFLATIEGLDRWVVKRDDQVGKELINEFKFVHTSETEKWNKCGEGEGVKDGVRKVDLVKQIRVDEVVDIKSLICNSL